MEMLHGQQNVKYCTYFSYRYCFVRSTAWQTYRQTHTYLRYIIFTRVLGGGGCQRSCHCAWHCVTYYVTVSLCGALCHCAGHCVTVRGTVSLCVSLCHCACHCYYVIVSLRGTVTMSLSLRGTVSLCVALCHCAWHCVTVRGTATMSLCHCAWHCACT
jgi:hypothetical protein